MPQTITKRDLVLQISDQTGLAQAQVFGIVQQLLDNITAHLSGDSEVVMRNFGTFEVRVTRPKIGRNPRDPGKDVPIAARAVVRFSPGKEMKEKVSRLLPELEAAKAAERSGKS